MSLVATGMLYTALYMAGALRTQIYLTREQRAKLDELRRREDKSLAELIRNALDAYVDDHLTDADEALETTFGAIPDLRTPSRDEWDDG
jgi:predicted DNA-binding protein